MEDVVVLVPGFLGFARIGGFYYFAERLIGVLRGSLEQPEGGALPVVPVTTLPTNSLRSRQEALLEELHGLSTRLGDVRSFHLIGHSTGGTPSSWPAIAPPTGIVGRRGGQHPQQEPESWSRMALRRPRGAAEVAA